MVPYVILTIITMIWDLIQAVILILSLLINDFRNGTIFVGALSAALSPSLCCLFRLPVLPCLVLQVSRHFEEDIINKNHHDLKEGKLLRSNASFQF